MVIDCDCDSVNAIFKSSITCPIFVLENNNYNECVMRIQHDSK